ncbi:uncharacterized protein RBU33_005784 isoform 3-T4 [Hipposideros larvatus]
MQPRKAGIATTVISGPSPPPRAWAALLAVGELGLCRPGVPRGHHLNISRKCAESLLYARPCTRCWGNSGEPGRTKPDKNDLGQRSLGALPQMKTTEGARNRESWGRPGTASVAIREIISRETQMCMEIPAMQNLAVTSLAPGHCGYKERSPFAQRPMVKAMTLRGLLTGSFQGR